MGACQLRLHDIDPRLASQEARGDFNNNTAALSFEWQAVSPSGEMLQRDQDYVTLPSQTGANTTASASVSERSQRHPGIKKRKVAMMKARSNKTIVPLEARRWREKNSRIKLTGLAHIIRKGAINTVSALAFSTLAFSAQAVLLVNGGFDDPTGGTATLPAQFSTNLVSSGLVVPGWTTTSGYSFLVRNGTDATSNMGGALGIYNGSLNPGGTPLVPLHSPAGGNFVIADGAFRDGTLSQIVTGFVVGQTYKVSFWQAAGQQQTLRGATTEWWDVSLGGTIGTTEGSTVVGAIQQINSPTMHNPDQGFVDWTLQSVTFLVTDPVLPAGSVTSELLGFLAQGTPNGIPPMVLLDNVGIDTVPEPEAYTLMVVGLLGILAVRGQRKKRA